MAIHQYRYLPEAIQQLQEQGLKVEEQLKILETIKSKLTGFALEKLNKSITKNPDLINFTKRKDFDYNLKTLYGPLVSVDADRFFSKYKALLTDRRTGFTEEYIEKMLVTQFNDFLISA